MPLKTRLFAVLLLVIAFAPWIPLLYADYRLRQIRDGFCGGDPQGTCSLLRIDVPDHGTPRRLSLYGYWHGKPFRLRAN